MGSIESRVVRWQQSWGDEAPQWINDAALLRTISASDYAAQQLQHHPQSYELLAAQAKWAEHDFSASFQQWHQQRREHKALSEAEFMQLLRRFKHSHQVALIHAVVNGALAQDDFLVAISSLASSLVDAAHHYAYQQLVQRYGEPTDEQGNPFAMTILAMGKFGGGELNFSSDIDLIFAYRCQGETDGGDRAKSIAYEMFFRKLAQKLIHLLDSVTEDGMVYRVDMRLRPFGQTGPLALSYNACEQYYLLHGRDWERYAMMKARPIAGDIEGGQQLLKVLRPFMYRRYLDYAALHAIVEMKQEINRQIREDGLQNHIKLGRGGIREAEFTVQAMQLIYGGQYPRLQEQNFLHVLADLAKLDFWPKIEADTLRQSYLFLREVENALQFDREQQTHQLPDSTDREGWQRLALACGATDAEALRAELDQARSTIHRIFSDIFAEEDTLENETALRLNWQHPDQAQTVARLTEQGVDTAQAEKLAHRLEAFAHQIPWARLPKNTLRRLDKLLPQVLTLGCADDQRCYGISGVLDLITEVCGRGVYIDMLAEQPRLLEHLLDIAASSSWLIQFICAHPLVLDDVLGERSIISDPNQLAEDLSARLERCEEDEDWLHALRDFKHAQVFKTAWADVHGDLPLMKVSDYLSHIATLVLRSAYQRAYSALSARYGEPRLPDGTLAQFAIIGYGKLGGLELSYGSDLDLLFLYDQKGQHGETDGKKTIANEQFFTRLVQRLNNYLSAPSASGVLYEVDTRLRPGGKSGLVVSSIQAFAHYQRNEAWTWEHQALTRARYICGSDSLGKAFTQLRQAILTQPRDRSLREEVVQMRQKMHDNHHQHDASLFDLKQSSGGLIDIEFIVQYLLLEHAHQEPIIARMSDNIRQLAALEATGLISSNIAMELRDAYRTLRSEAHRQYLNDSNSVVLAADWAQMREKVQGIWQAIFSSTT